MHKGNYQYQYSLVIMSECWSLLSLPSVYLPLNSNYQISHGCCFPQPKVSYLLPLCVALALPVHWVTQARTVSVLLLLLTDSADSC